MSVSQWRSHFPALQSGYTYFDNAGGSQTLASVADRVREYMLTSNVQHGASYSVSLQARDRVAGSINRLRQMINARYLQEIWLGASTTQLVANLATAMRPLIKAGDEIILTNSEHEANAGPWKRLAESVGARVVYWRVNPVSWRLELDDLQALINGRTRLLAMCQVSNILGAVNPVQPAIALAKAHGVLTCIDGVASAPHHAVDVQVLDCDAYVVSLYKVFGPHIGMMFVRDEIQGQLASVNHVHIPHGNVPYRFLPGGVCYELAYGAGAIVDYLESCGVAQGAQGSLAEKIAAAFHAFSEHENNLTRCFLSFLKQFERVRIIGPDSDVNRVGTISFTVANATPESICLAVDPHDIGIRHGSFHTQQLMIDHQLLAAGGVVRVSFAHYSTMNELEKLMAILTPLLS